jgi:glycerate kinase
MTNVLIAPNAFKNALDAQSVGEAIAQGLEESKLEGNCFVLPIADGGDGSLDILAHYYGASIDQMEVPDPLGRFVQARYGFNQSAATGVVELAEANGIRWLTEEELNPWIANTKGTGNIIRHLVNRGCKHIILTIGGSASIDGGLGILEGLGVRFLSDGKPFNPTGPCDFHKISEIDASHVQQSLKTVKFTILSDVENELLGEYGAVRVFGPQKGVQSDEIEELEHSMTHWVTLLEQYTSKHIKYMKSGGASGGVPVGLSAFFDVEILQGANEVLRLADFQSYLDRSDVVITTEGQIDAQTGYGKGPGLVAKIASDQGKKVIGLCGQIHDDYDPRDSSFDAVFSINSKLYPLNVAIARTRSNLRYMGLQIGNLLAR